MLDISNEKIAELKGKGFLFMKDKESFCCRVVFDNGKITAKQMEDLSKLSEKYAQGYIINTVRLSVEIPGIPYENVEPMIEEMDKLGFRYGGTGAKVRPVVSCKGTICKFGLVDTFAVSQSIIDEFYPISLPHKFKINVTGCPNNCAKVPLNDVGLMGAPKNCLRLFIGGRYGRQAIMGDEICTIKADDACAVIKVCTDFYKKCGKPKQRFGDTLKEMKDTPEYESFLSELKSFEVK